MGRFCGLGLGLELELGERGDHEAERQNVFRSPAPLPLRRLSLSSCPNISIFSSLSGKDGSEKDLGKEIGVVGKLLIVAD